MPFHTVLYTSASMVTADGLKALGVVTDTVLPPSGNAYQLPEDMRVIAAYAGAQNIVRARINTPSMLRVGYPSIRPVQQASTAALSGTPAANPNLCVLTDAPILARAGEPVGIDLQLVGTTQNGVGVLWLATKIDPVPKGESFWLRFTSGTALTELKWTVITPSFDQSFPSGAYAVTGLEFTSPGAVAARVVFPGSVFRPGVLAQVGTILTLSSAGLARTHQCFYNGSFGVWGTFQTSAPPSIEAFTVTSGGDGSTTQEGYLRVMRIGDVGATLSSCYGPAVSRG